MSVDIVDYLIYAYDKMSENQKDDGLSIETAPGDFYMFFGIGRDFLSAAVGLLYTPIIPLNDLNRRAVAENVRDHYENRFNGKINLNGGELMGAVYDKFNYDDDYYKELDELFEDDDLIKEGNIKGLTELEIEQNRDRFSCVKCGNDLRIVTHRIRICPKCEG